MNTTKSLFLLSLGLFFLMSSNALKASNTVIHAVTLNNGTSLELSDFPYNIHKELYFSFNAKIDKFKALRIGQRQPDMQGGYRWGSYLELNDSTITLMRISSNNDTTEYTKAYHNLNIQDTISLHIHIGGETGQDYTSLISHVQIRTKGESTDIPFNWHYGHNGAIFVQSVNTIGSNATLEADCLDFNRPVLILGDSYESISPVRWPWFVRETGAFNFLMDALSGATAWDTSFEIERLKNNAKPSFILWLLGMNNPDPDEETVQSSYLFQVNKLKDYCDNNKIKLIIATIPNTPTRNHVAKNQWIRHSGITFIDFATAVDANQRGSKWAEGLLSSDNLHPTANGAKVLANQIITDFPELLTLAQLCPTGDVNNDSSIDITDCNIINNVILNKSNKLRYGQHADVNNDEAIDVSDTNTLTNIILNKHSL